MAHLTEVPVVARPIGRFESLIDAGRLRDAIALGRSMRQRMAGRVLWTVNSTAAGGGVAEILRPLVGYARGLGIDTRWIVLDGNPAFFHLTKRLHHALHGSAGDGSEIADHAVEIYEKTTRANAIELCSRVRPRDVVLLHDPQTAGLAPYLVQAGALVVWRCHIGMDTPNKEVEKGWNFLAPYLSRVPAFVFSRAAYVPACCDRGKSSIIPPSIDAFSTKNCELSQTVVHSVLVSVGLIEGPLPSPSDHGFLREDGTPGRVTRKADVIRLGRATAWETPLVVQVSRWDSLKDAIGVMRGFAVRVSEGTPGRVELVLAGPNVHAVADDPEGARAFDQVLTEWRALPHGIRNRIHLASLPMADVQENALIVNALQRHATVVVQKSLREGFGLTVAEAMWKARPVLASAVGGIQDQIEDGVNGLLLSDPSDPRAFSRLLGELLENPERARALGEAARETVRERFLGVRHLLQYGRLFEKLDG